MALGFRRVGLSSEVAESSKQSQNKNSAVELKGSVFTLPILVLKSNDLPAIEQELASHLATAMKFFENAPVVIDLKNLQPENSELDFSGMLKILSQHQVIPVGVRNGSPQQNALAVSAGLAVLKGGSLQKIMEEESSAKAQTETTTAEVKSPQTDTPQHRKTKVIHQPVRSGTQVYAAGSDLIVMAPVNAGAEIIADGNIHVYSTLRGRALAGVRGDVNARIFCHSLEAELLAIAGNFRVFEDGPVAEFKSKPVQVYLEGEQLIIAPLK